MYRIAQKEPVDEKLLQSDGQIPHAHPRRVEWRVRTILIVVMSNPLFMVMASW
jgi:hypothetical protein